MTDKFEGFMQLPIRRRGNFMKDDFFKGFQKDFDTAIQDVMERHSGRSLLADQFSNYRKLRESSEDAGPAASISETQDSSVIVLDMGDFVQGSISVRTRGHYVIVDASSDSKSFSRKFPLSRNTNFNAVKTAMSNEGILTITAPKKDASKGKDSSLKIETGLPDSSSCSAEDTSALNGKEDSSAPQSPSASSEGEEDRVLSISKKGNFFQDEYFGNVWKDFEHAMDDMVRKEEQKKKERKEKKEELLSQLKADMLLEADRKQSEFFNKSRREEGASSLGPPLQFNRLNSYRNLRSWDPHAETQAVTITQDQNGYKIVMDVKNCGKEEGDVSVKASEGSLAVTGRRGSTTFRKEFSLKGLTNPDQVSASVSDDGVLTITAAV